MGKKKRTINNEAFGTLAHSAGDLWKKPFELHIFGHSWTVELMVDIDPISGIEQHQITAYKIFTENTVTIISESESAIFNYYQSVCNEVRGRYGITNPNDARVPLINSKEGLFRLVEPEGVTFPYARHRPTFGILCQCTWEEERGLAVKYENEKLVNVGFQDIVL